MRSVSALCVAALAATVAHALPDVTAVPLGAECHNYPGFDKDTGEAGPWPLYASSTDQPVARGAGSNIADVDPSVRARYQIGVAVRADLAKLVLRCAPNPSQGGRAGLFARADGSWRPVSIGPQDSNAFLLVSQQPGDGASRELQAYIHIVNGTQQEGILLGSGDSTTWAYKQRVESSGIDQFQVRLLTNPESLGSDEFKGFLRVGSF